MGRMKIRPSLLTTRLLVQLMELRRNCSSWGIRILILPAELRFVMSETFAGRGEVFVDCCEMIFQQLVRGG